jgi:hypothetical protein
MSLLTKLNQITTLNGAFMNYLNTYPQCFQEVNCHSEEIPPFKSEANINNNGRVYTYQNPKQTEPTDVVLDQVVGIDFYSPMKLEKTPLL